MRLILGNEPPYSFPMSFYSFHDHSGMNRIAEASNATAVGLQFFLGDKGPDNTLVKYSGNTGYADFVSDFGQANIKKYGQAHKAALDWLRNGGDLVTMRLSDSDAQLSHAFLSAKFDQGSVDVLYVTATGEVLLESDGETGTVPLSVSSFLVNPVIQSSSDMSSIAEIDNTASTIKNAEQKLFPVYAFAYAGKGRYGDNIEITFQKTNKALGLENNPLFDMTIYDSKAATAGTVYKVTNNDELMQDGGVPASINGVINRYVKEVHCSFYKNTSYEMDTVFEEAYKAISAELKGVVTTGTVEGITLTDDGKAVITKLAEDIDKEVASFEVLEEAYFDKIPFGNGGEVTRSVINRCFNFGEMENVRLKNGSNGKLAKMKMFDWDYIAPGETDKIVTNLFKDAFDGVSSDRIYDMVVCDVDMIIDIGYPSAIKTSIDGYTKKREDIIAPLNIPFSVATGEQAKTWITSFNPSNYNLLKLGHTMMAVDDATNSQYAITLSQLMIPEFINFYRNGFAEPISGTKISGYVEGSIKPIYNTQDDIKDYLWKNNVNYVSPNADGTYFLDGQQMNDLENDISKNKEFHNRAIANRICKKIYVGLAAKRHRLQNPDEWDKIQKEVREELQEFIKKVDLITFSLEYRSEYEEALGLVTVVVNIAPFGTMKQFRFELHMFNKASDIA